MNFNHTAAAGALLGGHFINSDYAMEDGRYGLEHFPLRLWSWHDGSLQEAIDHYYLAHTLTAQKAFIDYGPSWYDQLIGRSILLKTLDVIAEAYHPDLKRFVSVSSRTGIAYVMQNQDGVLHIVHTLSPQGALTDLDKRETRGAEIRDRKVNQTTIIGYDYPPREVALQTVSSPWAPDWFSNMVDNKALPFGMTAAFRMWGAYPEYPLWIKSWLGQNYGLTSIDIGTPTLNVMGLWKRVSTPITSADQLGLLTIRYGYNRSNMLDTYTNPRQGKPGNTPNPNGVLGTKGGGTAALQHENKIIVLATPFEQLRGNPYNPQREEIMSLQTTLAIITHQVEPTFTLRINGRVVPLNQLPVKAKAGDRITLEDGVSYIGIIPLEATDLGRDTEVLIHRNAGLVQMQGGGWMEEALLIENFNYRSDKPFNLETAYWDKVHAAYGGFIVEMEDQTTFPSIAAFENHLKKSKLTQQWQPKDSLLKLSYTSGSDTLELGFNPAAYLKEDRNDNRAIFPYRTVNGENPYLPTGIERDSPVAIQATLPSVTKQGITLKTQPGQTSFLLVDPITGISIAANPLPDPTLFSVEYPHGRSILADGTVGISFLEMNPGNMPTVKFDTALRDDQIDADSATHLALIGFPAQTSFILNGKDVSKTLVATRIDDQAALLVPLNLDPSVSFTTGQVVARIKAAAAAQEALRNAEAVVAAVLHYEEAISEHYILVRPSNRSVRVQRLWPSGSAFQLETARGITVEADGRVAFRSITVDENSQSVAIDAPDYMQNPTGPMTFEGQASAIIIAGFDQAPTVIINESEPVEPLGEITVDGKNAWVYPFGRDAASDTQGIDQRITEARALHSPADS